jgi:hypothetical protein
LSKVQQQCDRTQLSNHKTWWQYHSPRQEIWGAWRNHSPLDTHWSWLVVKYLWLILDKRLTWKMKNVMNKPYRTFWTCGGTFGKKQGLKPRVVHWIYTMVIRPILTYNSTVWWLKFWSNVRKTERIKLQRQPVWL